MLAGGYGLYICLCHGITGSQIRSCVESGARSICDLRGQLGVATQCGSCESHALELLDQTLNCANRAPTSEPAA
jgi:bacterioferritin-associated ferredoxin